MRNKIVDLSDIAARSAQLASAGKRIVVTNGCFDILHVGHVRYLEAARELGDALIVGINGDVSVGKLKGEGRPVNNERDRAEVVAALECVTHVAVFPDVRATRFLRAAHPAIYVKGGDYTVDSLDPEERAALEQMKTEIRILPLEHGYSTSGLLSRLNSDK
jgi:rfaE bifunctional protein nucleotidyltransferase chain/domain